MSVKWLKDVVRTVSEAVEEAKAKVREKRAMQGTPMCSDSMDDRYFVDFREDRFGGNVVTEADNENMPVAGIEETGGDTRSAKEKVRQVVVTPKSVLRELETRTTNFSLEGLDQKVTILEMKKSFLRHSYANREVDGLIFCLKNRKKYDGVSEVVGCVGLTYREIFARFDTTDDQKIGVFLKKHDLVMKDADIFIPDFPDEAIQIIDLFVKLCEELCKKKPNLYVIANQDQFRDADGKRDPILLAQSPFGFYYYILGAWDEEMLYLPEL